MFKMSFLVILHLTHVDDLNRRVQKIPIDNLCQPFQEVMIIPFSNKILKPYSVGKKERDKISLKILIMKRAF